MKWLLSFLKEFLDQYREVLAYEEFNGPTPIFDRNGSFIGLDDSHPVTCFFEFLQFKFLERFCPHRNAVDDGWAGPDSGCIDVICLDCGASLGGRTYLY